MNHSVTITELVQAMVALDLQPKLKLTPIQVLLVAAIVLFMNFGTYGCSTTENSKTENRVTTSLTCVEGTVCESSIRGHVVSVQASSVSQITSLVVRDSEGSDWAFVGDDYQGFSPSHLREHMLQGLPITVIFRENGKNLSIKEITD